MGEWRTIVTQRGFKLLEFTDLYGEACSLQESSLAEPAAIWFGCKNNAEPHLGHEMSPRMHLSQEDVQRLLPALQHFAEHGTLAFPPAETAKLLESEE